LPLRNSGESSKEIGQIERGTRWNYQEKLLYY
jgi:hypothetical protein